MEATTKRKSVQRALLIILASVIGWKLLYPVVTQPLQAKREAIARETVGLESLQNQLGLYTGYLQQIRSTGKKCLSPDAMTATIRYQEWVRECCEKSGIPEPIITIREPAPEENVGSTVHVTVRATASLEAVGNFIDIISSANLAHRALKINLQDWDSIGNTIAVAVDLDALSLKDNPTFDATLLSQPTEVRGFGRYFDEQKCFSRYVPPIPIAPEIESTESVSVSTAPPRPPRPDFLNGVMLVGIVQRNGAAKALFRDSLKGADLVFELDQEVRVDNFSAKVSGIESDHVLLIQGENYFQVMLGQSLRQGIESTDRSSTIY